MKVLYRALAVLIVLSTILMSACSSTSTTTAPATTNPATSNPATTAPVTTDPIATIHDFPDCRQTRQIRRNLENGHLCWTCQPDWLSSGIG